VKSAAVHTDDLCGATRLQGDMCGGYLGVLHALRLFGSACYHQWVCRRGVHRLKQASEEKMQDLKLL